MENVANFDYYLGLDIGTDSVGWAVTDPEYHILRRKGKSMWGIRLFDAAKTAEERRTFRTNRRRLQRKKQRIQLLQELFADEMDKVDPMFFQRLRDSAFWADDKEENQIYSLFNDTNLTDKQYYKMYPTIYHLRSELIESKDSHDIRLVYLALHHIVKHRGHFLFNVNIEQATSFQNTFSVFTDCLKDDLNIDFVCGSESEFEQILKNKTSSKTDKCKELQKLCGIEKTDKQLVEIMKLITGCKGTLSVIFQEDSYAEIEHNKISFSDGNYEEVRIALEEEIQERVGIIDVFQSLYNWVILADMLQGGEYQGQSYLSIAKVKRYEKHHEDLIKLKRLIRNFCPDRYQTFFASSEKGNYCSYVGMYKKNGKKISVSKCTQEDFYKNVKKILAAHEEDCEVKAILAEMEHGLFMPLQVSKDNGVIPYQVNEIELKKIIENAKAYLPFLNEIDKKCNKTVAEKIQLLFRFRIPYYVGPLNTSNGENSWMVRKEEGAIRPWNFENLVDEDQSAKNFINRMTNQCTYLPDETVLPKCSLLYSEYMVLNELNNVKIKGEKLSVELKQKIYKDLFQRYKQVTGKRLLEYLNSYGYDLKKEDLSGFDGNFKTSLTSYLDLREKVFRDDIEKASVKRMAENIILWITLYGDEQRMLKRVITTNYGKELTEKQIIMLSRLKYNGWGRLSRRFLTELVGVDKETGECMTIIQGLRNTQNNLMQLLSQKYTFIEEIEASNAGYHIRNEISYDSLVRDVVASPAIKRSVWQTVQIVEEIKKVMGNVPKKIFVEMARGEEEKVRTTSRKDKLLELYKVIDNENKTQWCKELSEKTEGDFKSIKLFLYYTQMGMCMYSGEKIDLSQLNDATIWDRDHIYPQSKTKDDSLDNLVLVKKTINSKKGNGMISPEIQSRMESTWRYLRKRGLISEKKYNRLMRKNPLEAEELAGFINRQLVETRQSSKVIATLLKRVYENTEIVYVKANAVSDYRKDCGFVKVREMNDYHHAKDAYLNIVVGNVYNTKFTNNPLRWLKENPNADYSLNCMFHYDLKDNGGNQVWKQGKEGTQQLINSTMKRNDILFTRYAYCNKGGFFNQTIEAAPKDQEKAKALVPLKQGMETWKYGGYTSITPSHFMLVESKDKKGRLIRTIETVPLYRLKEFEQKPELLIQYCEEFYGLNEPRIIIPCIKKNARLVVNGFPMHLKGSTGIKLILQGSVQLVLANKYVEYLKKIEKYLAANAQRREKKLLEINSFDKISKDENYELYNLFIAKLEDSIYKNRPANLAKKLIEKRDKFEKISIEEQCIVLGEILHLFQCKPVTADLTLIGEAKNAGKVQITKRISGYNSIELINQSPTGLYEQVIDLLNV